MSRKIYKKERERGIKQMRTLMIETVSPEETEISIELVKSTADLSLLCELGMSVKQLARRGVAEFLTPGGAQIRVTLMPVHSFIAWAPESLNGGVFLAGVKGDA